MGNGNHKPSRAVRRKLLIITGVLCLAAEFAYANPTGPAVANGQVGFSTAGNVLTVTNSPGSIINWRSFSIGSNEVTRFLQQSSASSVLNRVSGINPSTILGALQSNGRVFLINPSGIMFGPNAQIDVAGLVVSTLNLSDADFLAGRYRFTETPGAAGITNQGSIATTSGGMVYLVAPDIQNSGIIRTPQGEILLAAGKSVELVDAQTPEVRVQISAPDNQALNLGQLIAEGGRIGIYAGLIHHSGVANADTAVVGENGKIIFKATKDVTLDAGSQTTANGPQGGSVTVQSETGTTLVSGTVGAKGSEEKGGTVQLLGNQVGLIDNAKVDASGQAGGGAVLVGGDFHGANPNVQNATATYVGPGATINADAIQSGNGGKVAVWADNTTQFYGTIDARGGAQRGDGGFAEVSGKNYLHYSGYTDLTAPNGVAGTLLLDPDSIQITTSTDNSISAGTPFVPSPAGSASTVTWMTLDQALAGATVVVQTSSGDINIANSYNFAADNTVAGGRNNSATGTLELLSAANITAASGQTVTGRPGLSLWFNAAGTTTLDTNLANFDDVNFQNGATSAYSGIVSGTGTLTKAGAGTLILSGANTNSGGTTISAGVLQGDTTSLQGNITDNASVVFDQTAVGTYAGVISGTGAVTKQNTGNVTFSGTNTYGGGTTISGGALTLGHATDTLANSGAINVNGGTLAIGTNSDTVGAVTLTSGSITGSTGVLTGTGYDVQDGSISAVLGGGAALTKSTGGTVVLSGTNIYTGATNINGGVLSISADANLGAAPGSATPGQLTFNGGTLENTASFTLDANRGVTLNASGGTIQTDPASTLTYNGIAAGAGALTKAGTGTLILGGTNTYTGATNINAGTLAVTADQALGTSAAGTTVGAGGTLDFRNVNYATTEALTVNGGTVSTSTGTSSVAGTVALGADSAVDVGGTQLTLSGVVSGGFGLSKTGAGTLTLSGANTYTGATNINGGTLTLAGGAAIADTGAVLLANVGGVTLDLNGTNETIGSLAGGGTTGGVVTNGMAATSSTLTTGDATNTTFSGVIQDGSGTVALTKTGGGTFTLSGNNTYTGKTAVNGGTLSINADAALGTAPVSFAADQLSLNGGTLEVTATTALAANRGITLAGAGTINATTGTTTLDGNIANGGNTLTLGGAGNIAENTGVVISGAGGLTKAGAGTVTLVTGNTYTGATTIGAGTLNANASGALGDGSATNTLVFTGGTLQAGGTISSPGTRGVTLTSSGVIDTASNNVSIAGVISGAGGLTKNSAGTLTLSGANTYSGDTTIGAGTLQLGAAGVIPDGSGKGNVVVTGTLDLNGFSETINGLSGAGTVDNTLTATAPALTVGGNNATSSFSGAIQNTAGTLALTKTGSGTFTLSGPTNTYTGATTISGGTLSVSALADGGIASNIGQSSNAAANLVLDGGTLNYTGAAASTDRLFTLTGSGGTIDASGAGALNLTNTGSVAFSGSGMRTLTLAGTNAGNNTLAAVLGDGTGGATSLTKSAAGTWVLSGSNTYTGTTNVNAGTLAVTADQALGTSAAGTTVGAGGTLDFRNVNYATTEALTVNGGTVSTSTGTSSVAGTVALGADSAVDVGGTQLTLSGVVSGGFGLSKTGAGTLTLSGANTYTGTTSVNTGVLDLQNATAAGAGSVAVTNGAAVQVQGGITVANALTLNGTGVSNDGALRNISGSNTWSGAITDGSASRINSDSGTLTLTGGIDNGGTLLTVGGAGATTVNTSAISGVGGLTKDGAGTLTLGVANTYDGTTTISAGTVITAANNALGSTVGNTTVSSGATIGFSNGIAYNATETIVLNGTGDAGNSRAGALDNISGANSFAGTLTLVGGGNSTIGATAGSFTHGGSTIGASDLTYNPVSGTTITESGVISGAGTNVIKNGAGTLVLSGANTYDGNTTLNTGTLRATTSAAALGAGTLTLAGGTLELANDSGLNFGRDTTVTGNSTIVSDRLTSGAGVTQTLGTLSIGAQTLAVNAGANVASGTAGLTFGTATLTGGATFSVGSGALLTVGNVSGAGQALTVDGAGSINFSGTLDAASLALNNTAGTVSFQGNATVTTGLTTASNAFDVSFTGSNNSIAGTTTFSNTGTLTLGDQNTDNTTFTGGVTATAPVSKNIAGTIAATTGASAINLGTTAVTVTDNAVVGGAATGSITLGNATIADGKSLTTGTGIGNAVNLGSVAGNAGAGSETLVINTAGLANVTGAVGSSAVPLDQLTVTQSGGTTFASTVDAQNVTITDTAAGQTVSFQNAVTATNVVIGAGTGAYNVSLTGTGDAITNAVAFNNTGTLTLGQAGGTQTYNGGITATAPSGTTLDGTIATSNDPLTFGPITLGANTILNSGSGAISLGGTVNADLAANNRTLVINSTGTTALGGVVGGAQALASLTTDTGGTTRINGGVVTTTGAQTYNDAVTLGANTTLAGANVAFNNTLDSSGTNRTLTVNDSGTTTFGGAVGGSLALASLTTDAGGATQINGGAVTTTGAQTYNDAVTLGANTTLAGANVVFNNTLDSSGANRTLTVNDSGTTTFGGAVGGALALSSITTDAAGATAIDGGSVTTTGAQTYNDAVTLNADATFTSTASGNIDFATTLNSFNATARNLTVNSGGVATFGAAVGGTNALASLTTDAAGSTAVNGGSVTTAGAQTYNDAVTLGANTTFNGVNIAFNNTLNSSGTNRALTINDSGTTTLGGVVGGSLALASLATDAAGTTAINAGSVTTTGTQTYNDAVTVGANTALNAGSANVTFASAVDGPASLTVNSTGATTFNATVGGVTPLAGLATDAGGTTSLQDVTTTGAQAYGDNVVLKSIYTTGNGAFSVGGTTAFAAASTAINTGSGDITFTGPVNGTNNLTLTNTGTTTFASSVGSVTPLATLTASAGNFVMPAPVIAAGNVSMTGAGSYSVQGITTTGGGNIALTSTGGTLSVNAANAAAGGDVTFTADEIELTGAANSIIGSANLRLQPQTASQAIEIGGAGGTSALDITNAEITRIATGFPSVTIGQAVGTGAVSFNTSSFNNHLTVTGGSIAANGALTSAGKTITLNANSGGISSNTGTGLNVVADTLNANAVGNIALNTRVNTINAASSAGSITLVESDGATLANVSAPAGDVDITATTGNLALDTVAAGTTNNKFALLFAPGGAITDVNAGAVNVTAANIELVARDGIDLDTRAFNSDMTPANFPALQPSRLNAGTITAVNTGVADIDIRQAGNADILNVATASDQTTSGNITISGTDSLSVNTVTAGGLVYFGANPSITTKSVGGNMLITLNSPRASAGLSDPTVTLTGGGIVPVNDTGHDGGPGKVAVIERFVAPSGAVDYQVTGTGTGDNRFTLVVAGQVPVVGGTIKIAAPGAITDYTGTPPDTSDVINVLNLVGQTIQVSGFTSSLAYQLVTDGSGLEGFSPEQTLPASVAQLVQQIAASQRSTQDREEQKKQEALTGRICR